MNEYYPLLIGSKTKISDFAEFENYEPVFLLHNDKLLQIKEENSEVLQYLVASILRKPKNLLLHIQRILLCYGHQNEERLFAALVDFFVVLKDAGLSIKQRMLAGARSRLSPVLSQRLQIYLTDYHLIQGNIYTVLTSGIESNIDLVSSARDNLVERIHDPLQLARDYIEYSQIEEAKETLESAILLNPDSVDLHEELLNLYKSTKDIEAFNEMKFALTEIDHPMHEQWDALNSYFTQPNEK